ncbi:MAG: DNA mismatch repair endonuclease MutL [Lachnospiraceae bacterium]|nr:DNA mismatch repair endonuclease MutL [Lachnospiraceae bacterium]
MIHILSKETIDKIAAGEVAERPQSVVKELLDNAVDAGADAVSIEIRGGGLELIRVTDNGCGIPKKEVPTAFVRHATSKLETAEDIDHIRTMGFRGEALASIAAVSDVELITRTGDDLTGLLYRIREGREVSSREVGAPEGTTVVVRDFLLNVPVRRQFLKSPSVESSYIIDTVEKAALSHPDISFSLTVDGRSHLHSSGNGRLKDVIYIIYGQEVTANLMEVSFGSGMIKVAGYAGKPVISRSKRDYEVFFVNGRPIHSDVLQKAAEDAFAPFMMQHRFPMVILDIQLPPEEVDINVHPRKTEVRFADSPAIYETVKEALTGALSKREHIVDAGASGNGPHEPVRHAYASVPVPSDSLPGRDPLPFETKRQFDYITDIVEELRKAGPVSARMLKEGSEETPEKEETRFLDPAAAPSFKMIGQVFETYWIIEYRDEMYLIDQHAAHEKVNYERFTKLIRSHAVSSQMLFPPVVLTLSAREAALLEKNAEAFEHLGYEIEEAGDRDYIVRAVPSNLPEIGDEAVLMDLIQSMSEETRGITSGLLEDKIASMSCKAAVKGSRPLSMQEMKALISELLTLDNPYACPHGRPTIARWSRSDLDKIFKRIV